MAEVTLLDVMRVLRHSKCLHCRMMALIQLHYADERESAEEVAAIRVGECVDFIAEVVGDLLAESSDDNVRQRFITRLGENIIRVIEHNDRAARGAHLQ